MFSARAFRLSAAILVATSSAVGFAQNNAQPGWICSTTTKVKPEMRGEFEGHLKQLMTAYKKAGTPSFLTFETFAGDTREFTTVVPVSKFSDLDAPSVVIKVLGEAGWEHLSRNMARCYTSQVRQYATPQTALEINKADVPMGIYWVQTNILVAQDKFDDYLNWLQNEYRPALEEAGVAHFLVSRPVFGAMGGEIVSMRMLKNLAEIDGGPVVTRALGVERARAVNAKTAGLVFSSSTKIVRVRTDLSYSPGK
jgi:hypothetical protein